MTFDRFTDHVRSAEELVTIIGMSSAFSLKKELRALDSAYPTWRHGFGRASRRASPACPDGADDECG